MVIRTDWPLCFHRFRYNTCFYGLENSLEAKFTSVNFTSQSTKRWNRISLDPDIEFWPHLETVFDDKFSSYYRELGAADVREEVPLFVHVVGQLFQFWVLEQNAVELMSPPLERKDIEIVVLLLSLVARGFNLERIFERIIVTI